MISISNVTKHHKGASRPAVDGVSFEIERGDFVFLVGASGSGKSTLLRLMLREEIASRGEIYVLGQNLVTVASRKVPVLRRKMGVVFQDFRLLPNKTVRALTATCRCGVLLRRVPPNATNNAEPDSAEQT